MLVAAFPEKASITGNPMFQNRCSNQPRNKTLEKVCASDAVSFGLWEDF